MDREGVPQFGGGYGERPVTHSTSEGNSGCESECVGGAEVVGRGFEGD